QPRMAATIWSARRPCTRASSTRRRSARATLAMRCSGTRARSDCRWLLPNPGTTSTCPLTCAGLPPSCARSPRERLAPPRCSHRGERARKLTMTTAQADDTKRVRASYRFWAGGAIVGLALLIFGLIRSDDGTVPFFVLLGLAAVGYFATLHQVANGLRPSGRALIACAGLALAWRVPMLLAPAEPGADLRRSAWDARVIRGGLTREAVIPAGPAVPP